MNEKKKKRKIVTYFRRAVQVVSFLFLPALFIQIFNSLKSIILFVFQKQGTFDLILPNILLLLAVTFATMIAGRFFCGWMCAFGSMGDLLYRLPRLKNKNPQKYLVKADPFLKWLKYILLFVIVILFWGLQIGSLPTGINPWDLFGMLAVFSGWPSVSFLLNGWIPASLLLLLIIGASLFVERFFCRYLCPLGAYFGIISRFRPLHIMKKRDNCGKCTLCTQKCSMGINLNKMDKVNSPECINCMECTVHCPRQNAQMELSGENGNVFIAGTLSCALVAGSYYLGNFMETKLTGTSGNAYASTITTDTVAGIAADLADGTYSGSGSGFRGLTTVSVEVYSGVITGISIDSTSDDSDYIGRASSSIISDIITNQTTDVDTVSGATFSSNGIISAVIDALGTSSSSSTTTVTSTQEPTQEQTTATPDATSTDTTVTATIVPTTDVAATTAPTTDVTATTTPTTEAAVTTDPTTEAAITTTPTTEANATATTAPTTEAAATATIAPTTETSVTATPTPTPTPAASSTGLTDGTYEGSGTGFRGTTTVSVDVSGGKIVDITIVSYRDDQQFFDRASATVIQEIIDSQSVDVDAVSGATYSSNGIKEAVADALNLEFTASPTQGGHGRR